MTDVIIHSHGSWKPEYGYFQMPKGCSIRFFTHFAKTLMPVDAEKIIDGSFSRETEREIGEFKTTPNLRCSPITGGQRATARGWLANGTRAGATFYSTHQPRLLSDIIERVRRRAGRDGEYRFDWVCCQALKMNKVALGGQSGVNARHYAEDEEFMLVDRSGGQKIYLGRIPADSRL